MRINVEEVSDDGELVYFEDEPFTGVLVTELDDGGICEETYFAGVPHGYSCEYSPERKVTREWACFFGRWEGLNLEFHENGMIKKREWIQFGVTLWRKEYDEEGDQLSSWVMSDSHDLWAYIRDMTEKQRNLH